MNKIIIILILLISIGCKDKGETTTVKGRVVDFGTKEPIEGVRVNLRDGLGGYDPILGDEDRGSGANTTVYTDSDGRFEVSVFGEWGAHLGIHHPEYWNWEHSNGFQVSGSKAYLNGSTTDGEVFELKAFAKYQVYYGNTERVDSLTFQELHPNLSISGPALKRFYGYNGPFEITGGSTRGIGNDYFRYRLEVKRNGSWDDKIDSFYLPKGIHVIDTIYF